MEIIESDAPVKSIFFTLTGIFKRWKKKEFILDMQTATLEIHPLSKPTQ